MISIMGHGLSRMLRINLARPSRRNQIALHSVPSRFLRALRSLAVDDGYPASTAKPLSPLRFREEPCQESKGSRVSSAGSYLQKGTLFCLIGALRTGLSFGGEIVLPSVEELV